MSSKGQDLITELLLGEDIRPWLDHWMCAQETKPDWWFPPQPSRREFPIYLDGRKAHQSRKAQARDTRINLCLEAQGIYPLRIEYKAPLSMERALEAVRYIKHYLTEELQEIMIVEV